MVESILNSVLDKLADDAIGKFMHTRGVGQQVEKMRRELNRIQAFLKDADKKTIRDELQKHWVKEVRDLAYDIEDIIDNALLLEVEVPQENTSNEWHIVRMFKKPRKLPTLHKLGDQINQILERIEEISNSRIKYGISDLGEGSGRDFMLPLKPPMLPDIDDRNVVGFDTHRDIIVNALLDENIQRRSVVSIVGVGGLGKTTLARKAYNKYDYIFFELLVSPQFCFSLMIFVPHIMSGLLHTQCSAHIIKFVKTAKNKECSTIKEFVRNQTISELKN
jgi:ABC-type multidrug transport system fused ATPase/permease subunit